MKTMILALMALVLIVGIVLFVRKKKIEQSDIHAGGEGKPEGGKNDNDNQIT
jgi:hypothetical protein